MSTILSLIEPALKAVAEAAPDVLLHVLLELALHCLLRQVRRYLEQKHRR